MVPNHTPHEQRKLITISEVTEQWGRLIADITGIKIQYLFKKNVSSVSNFEGTQKTSASLKSYKRLVQNKAAILKALILLCKTLHSATIN